MKSLFTLVFVCIFLTGPLFGEDEKPTVATSDYEAATIAFSRDLKFQLDELKKLQPDSYITKIDTYRQLLEKYISHKRVVCLGGFSTMILSDGKSTRVQEEQKSLSKEETLLCFRELKAIQTTFINNMFIARITYLKSLHAKELKQLDDLRNTAIKDLQNRFDKKTY